MMAEGIGHRRAFGFIVGRRSGAMSIDITDLFGVDLGILHGARDGAGRPLFGRHHDVRGVRSHREPDDFGQNHGTTFLRVLILLEHEHRSTLPLDHAVAVERKRTTGVFRHHTQAFPCLHTAKAQHRFRATRDHRRGHAAPDHIERLAHSVV